MRTVGSLSWSLELSDDWEIEEDSVCASIWRTSGIGVLQFSAAAKDGTVTDGDLREFANDHMEGDTAWRHVLLGEFNGFEMRYEADEHLWRQWYLRSGSLALFATYNCDTRDAGIEDKIVDAVLAKLKRR